MLASILGTIVIDLGVHMEVGDSVVTVFETKRKITKIAIVSDSPDSFHIAYALDDGKSCFEDQLRKRKNSTKSLEPCLARDPAHVKMLLAKLRDHSDVPGTAVALINEGSGWYGRYWRDGHWHNS